MIKMEGSRAIFSDIFYLFRNTRIYETFSMWISNRDIARARIWA